MKTDEILKQRVMHGLKWELLFENCTIAVCSNDGNIILSGVVDNYTKKSQAENTTWTIAEVKSVINNIEVVVNSWEEKKDIEITNEILNIFKWNWNTTNETIQVKVQNGWVTLTGEAEWNYQKEATQEAVSNLIGVKGVTNCIEIKSKITEKINATTLIHALQNHLDLESKNIEIEILDSKIILKGLVSSWYQKEIAGRIAWKTPGVINVENDLLIENE